MTDVNTVLKLDRYERGAVLESLLEQRNELIRENRPTDTIDAVLIKMSRAKQERQRGADRERERDGR
jgi:hypothetical protein